MLNGANPSIPSEPGNGLFLQWLHASTALPCAGRDTGIGIAPERQQTIFGALVDHGASSVRAKVA